MLTFGWRVLADAAVVAFVLLACFARPASGGYFSKAGNRSEKVAGQDSRDSKDSKAPRDVGRPGIGQVKPEPGRSVTGPLSPGLRWGAGDKSGGVRTSGGYSSDRGNPSGIFGGIKQWGGQSGTKPETSGRTRPETGAGTSGWSRTDKGGLWGNLQTGPRSGTGGKPITTVPDTNVGRPGTARGGGSTGFFGNVKTGPGNRGGGDASQPVVGNYYGSTSGRGSRPVISSGRDWKPTIGSGRGSFFANVDRVDRPAGPRHTGSGYFETIRRLTHEHRGSSWRDFRWGWYYPYDFRFYHWYYGYYDPFAPSYPFAVYVVSPPPYYYYVYQPPVVLVTPASVWITLWTADRPYRYSEDDDYYPYVERVGGSLAQALKDIERGWRGADLDLLMRHVDPEGEIRVLYKNQYSHTLSAREFEDLTRDAFANTRTESFRFTSVKRNRDEGEAVAKGEHVLRDPNGERRVVYVIYLLEEARDRYGDWQWKITEVGQSPEPY